MASHRAQASALTVVLIPDQYGNGRSRSNPNGISTKQQAPDGPAYDTRRTYITTGENIVAMVKLIN
jgi:hypothetical protein